MLALSYNANQEFVGRGLRRTRIGLKWWNHLTADGWKPNDLSVLEVGGVFSVFKAPYSLEVPMLAHDWCTFQSTNRYDIWTRSVMPDEPRGIQERFPTAAPVPGVITAAGILFALAFPALNADRLVQLHENQVRNLVVFRSEPPGSGPVDVPIEISPEGLPVLKSVGRGRIAEEADFRAALDIDQGLSFTTSRFRGVKIKAPRVWDSAGRSAPIKLRLRQDGSRLVGHKVIPRRFFAGATYPVYADTTSTFYPDPDTESTSFDGVARRNSGETFGDIRGGDGTEVQDDQETITINLIHSSGNYQTLVRGLMVFDTASIPDGDTITAGEVGLYGTNATDNGSQSLALVTGTTASDTAATTTDYENNVSSNTQLATAIAISGWNTAGFNVYTLNATGRGAINKTGVTKMCQRLSGDLNNSDPGLSENEASAAFWGAEHTGTGEDPYLEVEHLGEMLVDLPAAGIDIFRVVPTTTRSAAAGQGLVDVHRVAPATTKAVPAGQGLVDLTAPLITPRRSIPAGQGLVDVLSVAATTTKAAAAGQGLVDIRGMAPIAPTFAAAGIGLVDVLAVAPGVTRSANALAQLVELTPPAMGASTIAPSGPVFVDVTPRVPGVSRSWTSGDPGLVEIARVTPTATFRAAAGQGLVELVAGQIITTEQSAVSGIGLVDLVGVAATVSHGAAAGPALIDFTPIAATSTKVEDNIHWGRIHLVAAEAGVSILADSGQGSIGVLAEAITPDHGAAAGPVALELAGVAAAGNHLAAADSGQLSVASGQLETAKDAASGQGLFELAPVAATITKQADAGPVVLELTAVSPATTKSFAAGVGLVELVGVAATGAHDAAAGLALLELSSISPDTTKAAAQDVVLIDVLAPAPAAEHSAEAGPGLVELAALAPASSKAAAAGIGLLSIELFAIGLMTKKFPVRATFARPSSGGTFRRPASGGTFTRNNTGGTFHRGVA